MRAGPQLSSIATALSELTDRLSEMAESFVGSAREDVAVSLYEVERSLTTAGRLLDKVVDDLG